MNKPKRIIHTRLFWCDTCDPELKTDGMNGQVLLEHLKEKHDIEPPLSGKKEGISFMDGEDYYQNTYVWHFPSGVKVTEVTCGPRGRAR